MALVFSPTDLLGMRRTQEAYMSHRARFLPWTPVQDPKSGQMVNTWVPDGEIACGVKFTPQSGVIEGTEGTVVGSYQIRLPLSMVSRAETLCRYEVISAYGDLLDPPWLLEQVGPPAPGPSGLLIITRRVVV